MKMKYITPNHKGKNVRKRTLQSRKLYLWPLWMYRRGMLRLRLVG